MKQERKNVTEQSVVEKIKGLEAEQIAEVLDFIEFLTEKKRETPIAQFLKETVGPAIRLEQLRARLATITGQMSDVGRLW